MARRVRRLLGNSVCIARRVCCKGGSDMRTCRNSAACRCADVRTTMVSRGQGCAVRWRGRNPASVGLPDSRLWRPAAHGRLREFAAAPVSCPSRPEARPATGCFPRLRRSYAPGQDRSVSVLTHNGRSQHTFAASDQAAPRSSGRLQRRAQLRDLQPELRAGGGADRRRFRLGFALRRARRRSGRSPVRPAHGGRRGSRSRAGYRPAAGARGPLRAS